MADGGIEVVTAVFGTVGLETGGVTTMGYVGPKDGVWVLVLVDEGVGSAQQPRSIVEPVLFYCLERLECAIKTASNIVTRSDPR